MDAMLLLIYKYTIRCVNYVLNVREGVKKTRLFKGHVPYRDPPPAKKFNFFKAKCKKYFFI